MISTPTIHGSHPRSSDYSIAKEQDGYPSESTTAVIGRKHRMDPLRQTFRLAGLGMLSSHPALSTAVGNFLFASPTVVGEKFPSGEGGILSSDFRLSTALRFAIVVR